MSFQLEFNFSKVFKTFKLSEYSLCDGNKNDFN